MTISVIIPTVNEASIIAQQVAHIRQHGGEQLKEVIVSDGESEDETVRHAEKAGAVIVRCAEQNRAAQMNAGAGKAKGDVLYFVHADVKLRPSFVQDIEQALQEGFDSGCYRYVFDSNKALLKINAWFTRFNRLIGRGGDQTLFIKRKVFRTLNGFDERFVIMEDYDILIRLRQQFKFKIIPKDILVSARKYEKNSWLRVQIANLAAYVMFRLKISPVKIKNTYKKMLN